MNNMNKKNYMKKTLSTVIASACAMVAIPAVASSVISSQNASLVSKQEKGSYVNGENANLNPNYMVTADLVSASQNDQGIWVKAHHENKFPIGSTFGNSMNDVGSWEKTYDGGKTFTKVEPNAYDKQKDHYLFNREDKEFQVRRIVDWYYENDLSTPMFTTNSKLITISKKISTNIIKLNDRTDKVDFKINLNVINSFDESIKFNFIKEYNGVKTIIGTTNNEFKKISTVGSILKSGNIFYYNLENVEKEINASKFSFEYEIITSDTTKRTDYVSFDVEGLSKIFKVNKPIIVSETNETLNLKIEFEKYASITDYKISFVEVDANGNIIKDGHVPFVKKISDTEYQLLKENSDKNYKVVIYSELLNAKSIGNDIVKLNKKEVSQPQPNPEPEKPPVVEPEPEKPVPPTDSEGQLPDNENIVGSEQNSAYNKSTIAIITTLSLIALIAVVCSIIFFINMRKNNKK